jgi:hypothetical protein
MSMLVFYDINGFIVWSNLLNDDILIDFKKYLTNNQSKLFLYNPTNKILISNEFFMNSLAQKVKSSKLKCAIYYLLMEYLKLETINKYIELLTNMKPLKKFNNDMMPVGFFINEYPMFYSIDKKWFKNNNYLEINKPPNQVVYGFDSYDENLNKKFRIKHVLLNVSKIEEITDKRLLEKGEVCHTKKKIFLEDIFDKLKIKFVNKKEIKINNLCSIIKIELMLRDAMDKNLRWYFYPYEKF